MIRNNETPQGTEPRARRQWRHVRHRHQSDPRLTRAWHGTAHLTRYQFKPGQSGNPGGRPSKISEAVRVYRDAAPEAAKRLVELMRDPDSRVAVLAAQGVYEKATGKHFDPASIREDRPLRINLDVLTLEELRFLKRICDRGAITLPPEQAQVVAASGVVIEGEADTISAPGEDNSET